MPTVRREAMLQTLKAVLQTVANAVSDLQVRRNPHVEVGHFPMLVLIDGGQEIVTHTRELKVYRATPRIEGYVKASDGDAAGAALNELYGQTLLALHADRTFGGTAMDLFEGGLTTEMAGEAGAAPHMSFGLTVNVDYQASETDPYGAPA